MVHRGEKVSLALEPCETLRIPREILGQELDRYFTAQRGVASSVNDAHSAGTELFDDLVVTEPCAGVHRLRVSTGPSCSSSQSSAWRTISLNGGRWPASETIMRLSSSGTAMASKNGI